MRAVLQRVKGAAVRVNKEVVGEIGEGLLVFLGVAEEDSCKDIDWLVNKVVRLRVFEDEEGLMNRSIVDCGGDVLLISQFTLYGNLKKGSRPSFGRAAGPEVAVPLYENFAEKLEAALGKEVPRGVFGAMMEIEVHNDGPVTLIIDSKAKEF